jgi:hypothetical protein
MSDYRVFISYSHLDKDAAGEVEKALKNLGVAVFRDIMMLPG